MKADEAASDDLMRASSYRLPLLTFLDVLASDWLASSFALLQAQRAIFLHCASHLYLQPVHLVPDVVHFAVEAILQSEVSFLAERAASDVACSTLLG